VSQPAIRTYLRAAVGEDPTGPADGELLARFAAARDESAFELLVWRHAALIQRVCRGVLRDHHAAEDAAQAAFLVLARKAHTFAGRGSVVGWLYRIARRAAIKLAKDRARRSVQIGSLDLVPAARPEPAASADEMEAICAEVDRLPERYRIPILLCFFEGLTHAEAARRTGWAIGTVAGRLARAKALLARRLARRGVGAAAVALGLPAGGFIGNTVQAATAFAARRAVVPGVPPSVTHLAEGVLSTMTAVNLKLVAAACVLCAAGTTLWGLTPGAKELPAAGPVAVAAAQPPSRPKPPAARDDDAGQPRPVARADAEDGRTALPGVRMVSMNKLRQIMLAMLNYMDANNALPSDITDNTGKPLLSWRVAILPYIEQDALYRQFKLNEPWDSEHNKKLLARMPVTYREDFQPKDATKTYFQVFAGPRTPFEPGKKVRIFDITDGTSNTIGAVVAGPPVEWTKPADLAFDPKQKLSLKLPYKNVFVAGFMDGSVHSFRPDIDPAVLQKFIVRDSGEVRPNLEDQHLKNAPTAQDVDRLQKMLQKHEKVSEAITAELREQQRLLGELARQLKNEEQPPVAEGGAGGPGGNPEDLGAVLQTLRKHTEELKRVIEEQRKK
jgi:RNA polymerase sigma factor (sigma-70 family)